MHNMHSAMALEAERSSMDQKVGGSIPGQINSQPLALVVHM